MMLWSQFATSSLRCQNGTSNLHSPLTSRSGHPSAHPEPEGSIVPIPEAQPPRRHYTAGFSKPGRGTAAAKNLLRCHLSLAARKVAPAATCLAS